MRSLIKFTKQELKDYSSPLVYVFLKKNIVIYVGKSKNGISRPFDSKHQCREARELSDEIHLYICEDEKEAIKLEYEMILEHKPKYNSSFESGKMNLGFNNLHRYKSEHKSEDEKRYERQKNIKINEWKRRSIERNLNIKEEDSTD